MALAHLQPGEKISLNGEGPAEGRTAALVKTERFEAAILALEAGARIPSHKVEGPLTLLCLSGRVMFGARNRETLLETGDFLYLEGGEPHELSADEDCRLLLTILFEPKAAGD